MLGLEEQILIDGDLEAIFYSKDATSSFLRPKSPDYFKGSWNTALV